MPDVTEQTAQLLGQPIFWRSAAGDGAQAPVLYVHGVPTSSDDWMPFLQAIGGVAPDLPGFGRSGKRGDGDFTIDGYGDFLEAFCELAGLDRVSLVVHDWGAVGLAFAQRFPERIERLVIIDAVPFLPGYRWHRMARLWRTPGVGEVVMGLTTKPTFRLASREANATPGPLPDAMVRSVMAHLDQGTQRAILRLYRSSPPDRLAAAGARLGELTAPALVVWGERDPYIDPRFADLYAERLPCAEVLRLPDAGHWPWLDRPDLVERIAAFLHG
jgi:pimeloyl-ACP methyl ester carboxylesterase